MNEVVLSDTASEGSVVSGPPVRLRQAREAAGLHIAALATALKVPVKKLEALEAGRYHELPDLTFARALASSACRHLKIDPSTVLDQIPAPQRTPWGMGENPVAAGFEPGASLGGASWDLSWMKRPAVWLSALALVAAAAVAWLPSPAQWPMLSGWSTLASSDASPAPVPQVPAADEAPAPSAPVSADASQVPAPEPGTIAQADPAAAPTAAATDSASASTPGVILSLTASAESWIEVVDGKGKLQMQRVLKLGEQVEFSAQPPYAVVLGRADAVQVQVRGEPFDVTPFARNSVARFEVK